MDDQGRWINSALVRRCQTLLLSAGTPGLGRRYEIEGLIRVRKKKMMMSREDID